MSEEERISNEAASPIAPAQTDGVQKRGLRKERVGKVVSDKMDKSMVVMVESRVKHPRYKKFMLRSSRFMSHDAKNECKVGDTVRIMQTRPLSRRKRWRLVELIEKAK